MRYCCKEKVSPRDPVDDRHGMRMYFGVIKNSFYYQNGEINYFLIWPQHEPIFGFLECI